jgi:ribonuclease D
MGRYELVGTDAELGRLIERLRSENPVRVAVDVEGENNLHSYGIHVALIQLFDGRKAWLVDPLSIKRKGLLSELMEDSLWLKVMFDATNDLLAFQHALEIRPAPLVDLAIAAQLLNIRGGLGALTGKGQSSSAKDKFQRANWMRRPISPELLDYAVSDVEDLLPLADRLMAELSAKGLIFEFLRRNWERQNKRRSWDPFPNYVRIPGYHRLDPGKQRLARVLWYARELYARKHDMSPENVATKPALRQVIDAGAADPAGIARILNEKAGRHRINARDLADCLAQAEREAPRESGGDAQGRSSRA